MKQGWERNKLGAVCEKISRGISPKYTEHDGVIVLNQKCIRGHKINFESSRKHDVISKIVSTDKYIRIGDVLVNSTGEGTLGRVAQVRDLPNEKVTVDSHVSIVRPMKDKFFLDFFGWAMIFIENKIEESGAGASGQTELARTVLENNFTLVYPKSIPEQQRIVSILDEAFTAIAKAKANAEQNLKNVKELFESYLQDVFENKGEGWEEKTLGEVCEIDPKKSELKGFDTNHLVSFLPMKDLGISQNQIIPIDTRKLSEVIGSYTYFRDRDVLLAKVTPCFENGKLGIAAKLTNGIGFGSSEYIVFRPLNTVISEYIFYLLSSNKFRTDGKKLMFGATGLKRLSKDYVRTFLISLPSVKEQQAIVKQLNALSLETKKLESIYQQKINDLEELKKSVLQKAFAGELKTATVCV